MSAQEEEFLQSLRATFKIEAREHLQAIAAGLLDLEKGPPPAEQRSRVETVFRAAHSLKGAARAVNFVEVESICQTMENTFAAWKREERTPAAQEIDTLHRLLDEATEILEPVEEAAPASVSPHPPPARTGAVSVAATTFSSGAEKESASDTVRISVAKLDAQLLEAEEMLAAKLMTARQVVDLQELAQQLEEWSKAWAAIQPEFRALRQTSEKSSKGKTAPFARELGRLLEFLDWSHDHSRSLEGKITALRRTAEQDRLMMGKLVDDLLGDAKKMLMLPVSTLGALFPKIVRDLCRDQGKEADLVIQGEELEVDKRILEEMKDPFIHLLRNCVDHGIEKPDERVQRGKPPRATITFTVSPINGHKVEMLVSDDGAGIDAAMVKKSAIRHGFITPTQANELNEAEALELIFHPDVSTSPVITQLSGRGLGLAIVREKTEKLGGRVSVESRLHVGTSIRITLPVAVATFRGILVEVAKRPFIVPTAQVERVVRFRATDVQTVEGRETLSLDGRAVALARLAQTLELPPQERREDSNTATPAVILGVGDQRVAFAVDAVLDEQEVLVKRFGRPLSRVRNIAGATVLGSGQVAPILNVADLLKSARKTGGVAAPESTEVKSVEPDAPSILVVEDSITSRMLLKGILEGAGYRVKTAVDGLEAYTLLRTQSFDLVVSDVEMPRLNGFDLTARIRADKKLAELPVVLITALETREDRERGVDAGASAYVIKSNFDQSNLLETVRRLV